MTNLRGPVAAIAGAALFLLGACARPASDPTGRDAGASGAEKPAGSELVLRVRQEGGFVPPEQIAGRIPMVSVYADGRVITEGPVVAIYPGPAMPNVQMQRIEEDKVAELADRAVAAGVRSATDLGRPAVADAPTTRIDVVTAGGTQSVSVEALNEATLDDPMLTEPQKAARAELAAFVRELTDLRDASESETYPVQTMAALAQPYHKPNDGLPEQPRPLAWPGPALPGEHLDPNIEIGCVVASGAELDEIMAAVADANMNTPWSSGGKQYRVTFRPLLPDETGCEDLRSAR